MTTSLSRSDQYGPVEHVAPEPLLAAKIMGIDDDLVEWEGHRVILLRRWPVP
jgi:hypothetical protein